MANADSNSIKRHWFLAVWSVPQVGHFVPASAYVWSAKRHLSIPTLTAAKNQRNLDTGAVLVNVSYVGYMTQYELTGTSPNPVPTVTSTSFNLGLEQALTVPDIDELVNAFNPDDAFNYSEWAAGCARGREVLNKISQVAGQSQTAPEL